MTVLLIDRRELSGMSERLAGEGTEITILADFGVIDMTLATDPPQQDLLLLAGGITTETAACLHDMIVRILH